MAPNVEEERQKRLCEIIDPVPVTRGSCAALKRELPPSIYFGGAAFGVSYFVGVFRAMVDTFGPDFHKHTHLCGGSIGTIMALQIALGKDPEYAHDVYMNIAGNVHDDGWNWRPSTALDRYVDELLASDPEIYKIIEGKFRCGTTATYSKHQWHTSWKDNKDLAACIKGSYNIPIYCTKAEKIDGKEVVDGAYGFTAEDLPHGDNTLFIGVGQPTAEVNREMTFSQMLIPAKGEEYKEMVQSGYDAFMKWDGAMKQKVGIRMPNYPALRFLWLAKLVQMLFLFVCSFIFAVEAA